MRTSWLHRYYLLSSLCVLMSSSIARVGSAETISDTTQNKFHVKLEESRENDSTLSLLTITAPNISQSTVFNVENPNRVVIDFPDAKGAKSAAITTTKSSLVKTLRIGSHPDKVRIVLDLRGTEFPLYSYTGSPKEFTLKITSGKPNPITPAPTPEAMSSPASATEAPTGTPGPTPTGAATPAATPLVNQMKAATPTQTPKALPSAAPSETLTASPTPMKQEVQPSKTPEKVEPVQTPTTTRQRVAVPSHPYGPGNQGVNEIVFDYLEPGHIPVLKFLLGERAQFQLAKKGDKNYLLTIPDCGLTPNEKGLPFYPPHDFTGFTYILAEATGKNVEVTIGIERGVRIASFAKDNEIWIKALNK